MAQQDSTAWHAAECILAASEGRTQMHYSACARLIGVHDNNVTQHCDGDVIILGGGGGGGRGAGNDVI